MHPTPQFHSRTYQSSGPYLHLRFTSNEELSYAGFAGHFTTVAISAPVFNLLTACPGPVTVSIATFTTVSLPPVPSHSTSLNCSVVVYTGEASSLVRAAVAVQDVEADHGTLTIRDGAAATSPLLAAMSGGAVNHSSALYVVGCVLLLLL